MKTRNKISAIVVATCLSLGSCNVDPELTSEYPEDVAWSNETNVQLYINGFYSLIAGYYNSDDCYADITKENNPTTNINAFIFGNTPITPASNPFDVWGNRHTWQINCCRFLAGLEEHRANFSETFANQAEAQVRFFRAVANFDLAKRYGASFILYKELSA